jgi:Amt family ammonium transporter
MTIEPWWPSLLGYLIPVGLFLLGWGGMEPARARRSTTIGALTLALGGLGYFAVGFALHLGGAGLMSDQPGLASLTRLFAGEAGAEWGLVGLKGFLLLGDQATPEIYTLFFTYLPLVSSAVLLTVLSLSGRARGWQMAVGGLLVAGALFPLAACWAWGGGWLANLGTTLGRGHGFVDYGGSGIVYALGGFAALGAVTGLGLRLPHRSGDNPQAGPAVEMPPAHFPLLANLGALLFGLGSLAWSLSRPFHVANAGISLPLVAVNGLMATTGAIITSQAYCWLTTGQADALMSARGAASGFVAIAASAPFVPPWAALAIGAVAGLLLPLGIFLVEHVLYLPDATATIALGITAGTWGLLALALFADGRFGQGWNGVGPTEYHTVLGQGVTGFLPADGFTGDGRGQLVAQLAGLGAVSIPVWAITGLTFFVLGLPGRARKDEREEIDT